MTGEYFGDAVNALDHTRSVIPCRLCRRWRLRSVRGPSSAPAQGGRGMTQTLSKDVGTDGGQRQLVVSGAAWSRPIYYYPRGRDDL